MVDPEKKRRALVLAHEPDGPAGQVGVRLSQRGYEVHTHVVTNDFDAPNRATPFPSLDGFDVLVLMGSVRSLTNKEEIDSWIYDELELVRTAHANETPILGVCFGLQLIAEALGGKVEKAPTTELGWYEIEDGPDGPNPFGNGPWLQWHHDRIVPPPDAAVLAVNENAVQVIRIGFTLGTQFHPEVDLNHLEGYLMGVDDEYLTMYGVKRQEFVDETRRQESANIKQCHQLVDWFLDDMDRTDAQ